MARAEGARRNAAEQTKLDEQPKAMRTEDFARLSLQTAIETGWREETWHAWAAARDLREAVEEFFTDSDGDPSRNDCEKLREAVGDSRKTYEWRKPNALAALLAAIDEGDMQKAQIAAEGFAWKPKVVVA